MRDTRSAPPIAAAIARAIALLKRAAADANARRAATFDPVRSLYVVETEVSDILRRAVDAPQRIAPAPALIPELARLSDDPRIHDALALAIAAEYVPRLDRVFGFLHDDLTRRGLSVALLVELCGADPTAFDADGFLARMAAIVVHRSAVPQHATVRCDPGLLAALGGETHIDARIRALTTELPAQQPALLVPFRSPLVLWGGSPDELARAACDACAASGRPGVRLADDASPEQIGIAAREALLRGAVLVLAAGEPQTAGYVAMAASELPVPVIIEAPSGITNYSGEARRVAQAAIREHAVANAAYPLPYGRRVRALRRLEDVILPDAPWRAVRSVVERMRQRDRVTREWGVDTGSAVGGVRALFAGPPGTGKTLAAEAIAQALERDLYVVDVGAIASKYIGDTEKALAAVFAEAARAGVVLLFDEADALFSKRTDAKDAHDRYANLETAYLLGALDLYADVAILATNMANNIDDALVRRIDVRVDFPMPDVAARGAMWRRTLGRAPLDGVDFSDIAQRFVLSGGGIQSAALSAAYAAATGTRAVTELDLVRAARAEFAKAGRVAGRLELGSYYDVLRSEG
jgi:ATPase family associated with various cellular activities (AAA)